MKRKTQHWTIGSNWAANIRAHWRFGAKPLKISLMQQTSTRGADLSGTLLTIHMYIYIGFAIGPITNSFVGLLGGQTSRLWRICHAVRPCLFFVPGRPPTWFMFCRPPVPSLPCPPPMLFVFCRPSMPLMPCHLAMSCMWLRTAWTQSDTIYAERVPAQPQRNAIKMHKPWMQKPAWMCDAIVDAECKGCLPTQKGPKAFDQTINESTCDQCDQQRFRNKKDMATHPLHANAHKSSTSKMKHIITHCSKKNLNFHTPNILLLECVWVVHAWPLQYRDWN